MTTPAIEAIVELLRDAQAKNQVWPSQLAPRVIAVVLDNLPRAEMVEALRKRNGLSAAYKYRVAIGEEIDCVISAVRATLLPGDA